MVDATSLIGDMDSLHDLYADGMATVQEWNKSPYIELRRRAPAGGWTTAFEGQVISVKRDNTQERGPFLNQGAQEIILTGTLKAWHPFPGLVEDRFMWGELLCEIKTVPPPKLDTIQECSFVIVQSNQEVP